MLRRTDAFGLLGLLMLLAGFSLYFAGSGDQMSWWHWLGGPVLWFGGFALFVGWAFVRWSHSAERPPK